MCIKYTHTAQAETNQKKLDMGLIKPPRLLGVSNKPAVPAAPAAADDANSVTSTADGGENGAAEEYLMVHDPSGAVYGVPALRGERKGCTRCPSRQRRSMATTE